MGMRLGEYITVEVTTAEMSAISLALDRMESNAPFIADARRKWDKIYRAYHGLHRDVLEIHRKSLGQG